MGWSWLLVVLGGLFALGGAWLFLTQSKLVRARMALPVMARSAVVTDRRSETALHLNTGITTYFFTLEFGTATTPSSATRVEGHIPSRSPRASPAWHTRVARR